MPSARALPIPSTSAPFPSSCNNVHNCRTLWDIVTSCMATVFSCTWVAIHPNIPAIDDKWWTISFRRAKLMVLALIAPELVILWAMRQWYVARDLAKRYQGRGWTLTHGFFAGMGGFMLSHGNTSFTLGPQDFNDLLTIGAIDFPTVTEDQIDDKNKSDTLAKALAALQLSWFMFQCIMRTVEHLPLTELEVMTLAFTILTMPSRAFWWQKPLNVRLPVPVKIRDYSAILILKGEQELSEKRDPPKEQYSPSFGICVIDDLVTFIAHPVCETDGTFSLVKPNSSRVRTLFAGETTPQEDTAIYNFIGCVAMVFGAIHCIAWSSEFTSDIELLLWRVSSAVLIGVPALHLVWHFLLHIDSLSKTLQRMSSYVVPTTSVLYALARFTLIFQSFASLRSLSPGSYDATSWTAYIPHL
ncbi:hypothetical protein HETIRDRAFT_473500 [Heterobasidion irregulare TC 32-1]|uniref:Uncharacterized protein n=1 Tax=Heterobasidion irregulare (strain TC 32-1) TaxID=747525 RepID=W4KGE7_HETIT|nr:uncharacterized protein HETIRDRAFT_473500 [Heterobasidion irregulare TC 32-1]ETW84774.1 hypothetical protein HETIRDRAFT_473500 [Heterobasidion irregulare TC 32-1]